MKKHVFFLIALMFAGASVWAQGALTLQVPSEDYPTIQSAIDSEFDDGFIIEVAPGTYNEQVRISRELTLKAVGDEPIIIDGSGSEPARVNSNVVITITASNVTLDGLTIQSGEQTDPYNEAGVLVAAYQAPVTGVIIQNCIIQNNANGIGIAASSGNTIKNNVIKSNIYGVALVRDVDGGTPSTNNAVLDNEIYDCFVGVYVDKYCASNEINANNIYDFGSVGIYLWATQNNIVSDNRIAGFENVINKASNSSGIEMAWGSGNEITTNTIIQNAIGIEIRKRIYEGNYIENNIITDNTMGLIFHDLEEFEGDPEVVVANCNWWGTVVETEIQDLITGDVDFTPYLLTEDIENPDCRGGQLAYNVDTDTYFATAQLAVDADLTIDGHEIEVYYLPESPLDIDKLLNIHYVFDKPEN